MPSRRAILISLAVAAVALVLGAVLFVLSGRAPGFTLLHLPVRTPVAVEHYGPAPLQIGELRVPDGKGPFPLAIVIHGGCYLAGYEDLRFTAPLASSLTARGIATWNIDYRALGDPGGGWPGTFADLANATAYVRKFAGRYRLDLDRVAIVGHSAGAHAALWLASRSRGARAPFADIPTLPVRYAVAIDGPPDLAKMIGTDERICERPVVVPLMGGTPASHPERYLEITPARHLPLGVAQLLVPTQVLRLDTAIAYRDAAGASGDRAEVLPLRMGHFDMLDPRGAGWKSIEDRIAAALAVP
ncbi:alpha/beta hydrolase [Cognatilysobacter lacus]|nr:alpha/beta hydrolase [Lysobacter lacus]